MRPIHFQNTYNIVTFAIQQIQIPEALAFGTIPIR